MQRAGRTALRVSIPVWCGRRRPRDRDQRRLEPVRRRLVRRRPPPVALVVRVVAAAA